MNKVCLIGRLTKNPEIRVIPTSNTTVTNFTIAVSRKYVKEGEERQADFIPIISFGKIADFCSKYFQKGQQVGITGRIQTRNWNDESGQKHFATDVIAEEVFFADSKKDTTSVKSEATEFEETLNNDDLPF